ncbi:hypothetical protein N4G69_20255 [Streptomyces mirabilis]|uniref:DUF6907 domain-containing protein n=1 Tax=Streptomyces mirabilis TaxID=68239 RepID=UPI0021C24CE0|nr:hypothetical protein [Streptomyces mirabilis]MCT9107939.1 hypothetical protein [Streptomyces mirabilis]
MSTRRTVTIHTVDHGPVTIPEPSWCAGRHRDGGARVDITHVGPEQPLTLPTRDGPAVHLVASLESRPFVHDTFLRGPFMDIEIDGDHYPTGLAGLERMADTLAAHADALRDRARELAVILAGGEPR